MEHFAGRTDELAILNAGMRAVRAGQPRVVLVEGEAGVGKSSLLTRAAAQLLEHTVGNALHCRSLLEEFGPDGLARAGRDLPAPRALAAIAVSRLTALSEPAQRLVMAAAVLGRRPLGRRSPLATVATLADLADPATALDKSVASGLVAEEQVALGTVITFAHPLVHAAVRDSLRSAERRRLHRAAVPLMPAAALAHRLAAVVGPDGALAGDLDYHVYPGRGTST